MECSAAIKNNDFIKFLGKWMELENIILSDKPITHTHTHTHTHTNKTHTWYVLTDKLILAQKLGIPKIQFIDHMKGKKKEDQNVDVSVHLRRGNKILTGGNMKTKYGAEPKGKAIQRLPHLDIHPIYSHQTQTLLQMPRSAC